MKKSSALAAMSLCAAMASGSVLPAFAAQPTVMQNVDAYSGAYVTETIKTGSQLIEAAEKMNSNGASSYEFNLAANIELKESVTFNKNTIVNLNGYNITFTDVLSGLTFSSNGTINGKGSSKTGGTLILNTSDSNMGEVLHANRGSKLDVSDVTIKSNRTGILINSQAELNLSNSEINAQGRGLFITPQSSGKDYGAKAGLNAVIINAGESAIYNNPTSGGSVINISGSTLSSSSQSLPAVFMGNDNSNATHALFISSSNVSGTTAIEARNTKVDVDTNSSIKAASTGPAYAPKGTEPATTGYAVVLTNNTSSYAASAVEQTRGSISVEKSTVTGPVTYIIYSNASGNGTVTSSDATANNQAGARATISLISSQFNNPGNAANFYSSNSAAWETSSQGTRYYRGGKALKGLSTIGGDTYYFNEDTGVMAVNATVTIGGRDYRFGPEGKLVSAADGDQNTSGKLVIDKTGTRFLRNDGKFVVNTWEQVNGDWYYFGGDSYAVKGLQEVRGQVYFFNDDGVMKTGWIDVYNTPTYFTVYGWRAKGRMIVDGYTYLFDDYGHPMKGWQKVDNDTYYFDAQGRALTGIKQVGDATYCFGDDGVQKFGWIKSNGEDYYFGEDGIMVYGWQEIKGETYYFNEDGTMIRGRVELDGDVYWFNIEGEMLTGFQKIEGNTYYFNQYGKMQFGWQEIGGNKYYFNTAGVMATGTVLIDGKNYDFNSDGTLKGETPDNPENPEVPEKPSEKGWVKKDGIWYFYRNGTPLTGWQKLGEDDDKQWYFFDADGRMQTGWQKLNWGGKLEWFYFDSAGVLKTGWMKLDWEGQQDWYYFNEDGVMIRGWKRVAIDGETKWFYFDSAGKMKTGWMKLEWQGKSDWYYFYEDGMMATDTWIGVYRVDSAGICLNPGGEKIEPTPVPEG